MDTTPIGLARGLAPRIGRLVVLLRKETAAAGISVPQLRILSLLSQGNKRVTELAEIEQVTQPAMTTHVARIEAQGWIRRKPDPYDRRSSLLEPTAKGRREYARSMERRAVALAGRLEGLTAQQRKALAGALSALDAILIEEDSARAR